MPVATIDKIKDREASIKKKIADLGQSPDQAASRELGKKLRRTQRRRRRMAVEAERRAAKSKHPESAAAPEASAPAEAAGSQEAKEG